MSSTASTTASTPPIPLTAPFIPPSNCSNRFPDTISLTETYPNDTYPYHIFPSSEDDPLCQPSGVATYPTPGRQFSPAVCPSAWTAYDFRIATYETQTISVAQCCSSGFTYSFDFTMPQYYAGAQGICTQHTSIENTTTTHTSTNSLYPPPTDFRAHLPWQVSWQASDRSTLSPMPPTLREGCMNPQLRTWVPGTPCTLDDCKKPPSEPASWSYTPFLWFCIVGIPLIAFAIIILCVWNCCRIKRKGDEKYAAIAARQAQERAAAQAAAGSKNDDTNVVGAGTELPDTKKQVDSTQYMGQM